jgi:2-phosphosulfolactate phosphatase
MSRQRRKLRGFMGRILTHITGEGRLHSRVSRVFMKAMTPEIEFLDFIRGARTARGAVVIIDVFRACSTCCYAFARGVARIIPVGAVKDALELKHAHPEFIVLGERYGRRLPRFDGGNSPTELERLYLHDRTVVHTTHSGTQGLVNARADVVITGSFVNASAVCRYLAALRPERISLVRMGVETVRRSEADDLCAELIAARVRRETFDEASIRARLRESSEAQKFFNPKADWAPERDFELCTALDRFDFVLRMLAGRDGRRELIKIPHPGR